MSIFGGIESIFRVISLVAVIPDSFVTSTDIALRQFFIIIGIHPDLLISVHLRQRTLEEFIELRVFYLKIVLVKLTHRRKLARNETYIFKYRTCFRIYIHKCQDILIPPELNPLRVVE